MRPTAVPTIAALLLFALAVACGGGDPANVPGNDGGAGGEGGTGGGEGGTGGAAEECGEGLPAIERLEPDHGMVGDPVRIYGRNFAPNAAKNQITFSGQTTVTVSVGAGCTVLETRVPANATTGPVRVLVDGVAVDGPTFTVDPYPAPHLTALSPDRVPVGEEAVIFLIGTDFRPGTQVLLDGEPSGNRYLAPTRIELRVKRERLQSVGTHTVQAVVEPPGGGASEILEFRVVHQYRLLRAEAVSATGLDLRFEEPPDPVAAADVSNYAIDPPLEVTAAARDPGDPTLVHLTTAAQEVGTRFTITGKAGLLSEEGLLLVPAAVRFRAFGSVPDRIVAIPKSGCDGFTVSAPGGLTRVPEGFYLLERTGHQVQIVDEMGNARGYLGHNGTDARRHDVVNDNAAGCPGPDGSAEDGAFRQPRGAVARLGNGDFVVGDTGNGRLQRWSGSGAYRGTFGEGFTAPVVLGKWGDRVAVADTDDRIRLYSEAGALLEEMGGTGDTLGTFRFGIAAGETPALAKIPGASPETSYLTDPENHRVIVFIDGEPSGFLGGGVSGFRDAGSCCTAGEAPAAFDRPLGIAWGDDNKLWVIDAAKGGRIQRFSADGEPEYEYRLGFIPGGLALGRSDLGEYWLISDPAADKVYRFQP
jgi:hypothetical protein